MSLETATRPEAISLMAAPIGSLVTVHAVEGVDDAAFALLDIGVRPGASLRIIRRAPLGCPLEIALDGARFAIRCESASKITVQPSHD